MGESRPWFVPYGLLGRGWRPATWEGWSVLGAYLAVVLGCCLTGDRRLSTLAAVGATAVLLAVVWQTGARPAGKRLLWPPA